MEQREQDDAYEKKVEAIQANISRIKSKLVLSVRAS